MKKIIFIVSIFTVALSACNNSKEVSKNNANKTETQVKENTNSNNSNSTSNNAQEEMNTDGEIFASIRRTACFGKCPTFEMIIYKDGHATYEGLGNVDKLGKYEATVSKEIMQDIQEKALGIGYFDFKDEYNDTRVMDVPSTYTHITVGDKSKSIMARFEIPPGLLRFQDYLDGISNKIEWTVIEEYK
ncbi:MAG: DUF6438 domain-containing protein [Brumimicrobium sp.]|nr:DUF6438 domain-containing protein [Brumimicrobium sp.]